MATHNGQLSDGVVTVIYSHTHNSIHSQAQGGWEWRPPLGTLSPWHAGTGDLTNHTPIGPHFWAGERRGLSSLSLLFGLERVSLLTTYYSLLTTH